MSSNMIESVLGGIIGFLLAQIANFAYWAYAWLMRPQLRIELISDSAVLLYHEIEADPEEGGCVAEEVYGFRVRNSGRSISHKVRFQVFKTECRENGLVDYSLVSDATFSMATYSRSGTDEGSAEVTLVPGASVDVELASWRDDHHDLIVPSVGVLTEYYEEGFSGVGEFRFSVVVFDESERFTKEVIIVRTSKARKRIANGGWLTPRRSVQLGGSSEEGKT